MDLSKKAIAKWLFGDITFIGDLAYIAAFDDQDTKKALIGAIPIPGTSLIHLTGGNEDDEEGDSGSSLLSSVPGVGGKKFTVKGRESGDKAKLEYIPKDRKVKVLSGSITQVERWEIEGTDKTFKPKFIGPDSDKYNINKMEAEEIEEALGISSSDSESSGPRSNPATKSPELTADGAGKDDSSFSLPGKWSISRIGFMSIVGVLVLFVGGVVATGGGGPAAVAGDYLGANVDGPEFDGIGFMANKAVKTVSCFGDEGCIREWQLNNTRRPGSEDVGETYKLNIKNFQVYGSGGNADVGYSSPSDSIPIYFLVQNARHGLKGIDASNVKYKVRVRDEGLLSSRNYCETDWLDLETSYGSGDENVLIPGAASEPLEWQEQLTLRQCGLLQPGPGNYVNFVLEVKYDYASQSTLYVDAMSQEHRRSQQIPIDFKRSETADTPVETFIETRSPLLFSESNGERTSIPFTTRVGVHTDNRDIDYTIDTSEFVFEDSSITEDVDGSCQGLRSTSENEYVLSGELSSQIQNRQRSDDGNIQWFNYQTQPPPASCTMRLSNSAEGVSRTGETLTMSADVEYTVKLEEKEESFQILNSRCSTANCPMLVPLHGEDISEKVVNTDLNDENPSYSKNEEYWTKQYAYCRGNQDAQNGCSVIESFKVEDRGTPIQSDGKVVTIEEGDIAVDLSTADNSLIHCDSEKPEDGVQTIDPNELKTAVNSEEQALSESVSGWRVESTENCEESEENN